MLSSRHIRLLRAPPRCPCSSPFDVSLPLGPHLRTSIYSSHSFCSPSSSMLPRVDPQVCSQQHHLDAVNHVSLHLLVRHVLVSFCRLRWLVSLVRSAWLHLLFPEFIFPSFQRKNISAKLVTSPGFKALRVSHLCRISFPACSKLFFNLAHASGFANSS